MKTGDLVRVREHCKNGGAMAIVLETFSGRSAKIQYVAPPKKGNMTSMALFANLEVVSE
jgi:hypothetical protein